jgi:hypothetical protein
MQEQIRVGDRVEFHGWTYPTDHGTIYEGIVFRVTPKRGGTLVSIHRDPDGATFTRYADKVTLISNAPLAPPPPVCEEEAETWAAAFEPTSPYDPPSGRAFPPSAYSAMQPIPRHMRYAPPF